MSPLLSVYLSTCLTFCLSVCVCLSILSIRVYLLAGLAAYVVEQFDERRRAFYLLRLAKRRDQSNLHRTPLWHGESDVAPFPRIGAMFLRCCVLFHFQWGRVCFECTIHDVFDFVLRQRPLPCLRATASPRCVGNVGLCAAQRLPLSPAVLQCFSDAGCLFTSSGGGYTLDLSYMMRLVHEQ